MFMDQKIQYNKNYSHDTCLILAHMCFLSCFLPGSSVSVSHATQVGSHGDTVLDASFSSLSLTLHPKAIQLLTGLLNRAPLFYNC